jgi:hypothetical protein
MAKHDKKRKIQRNQTLVKYKDENPDLSWEEVGEVFGVSRQRAWLIYHNEKNKIAKHQPEPV